MVWSWVWVCRCVCLGVKKKQTLTAGMLSFASLQTRNYNAPKCEKNKKTDCIYMQFLLILSGYTPSPRLGRCGGSSVLMKNMQGAPGPQKG